MVSIAIDKILLYELQTHSVYHSVKLPVFEDALSTGPFCGVANDEETNRLANDEEINRPANDDDIIMSVPLPYKKEQ